MAIEIRMPQVSPDVEELDVVAWLVAEGGRVRRGQPILEVETEKSTLEIEAPADGILNSILVEEGSLNVSVGILLALIEPSAEEGAERGAAKSAGGESSEQTHRPANPPTVELEPPSPPVRSEVAPTALARRLADRAGIPIHSLEGSGSRGRVLRSDVENQIALASGEIPRDRSPEREGSESDPAAGIPSQAAIPGFQLSAECSVANALGIVDRLEAADNELQIGLESIVIRAASRASRSILGAGTAIEITRLSSSAGGRRIRVDGRDEGLTAISAALRPLDSGDGHAIEFPGRDEDRENPARLRIVTCDIAGIRAARFGPDSEHPIVLGVGAARPKTVVESGASASGWVVSLDLGCDGNRIPRASAGNLLAEIKRFIEEPLGMLL